MLKCLYNEKGICTHIQEEVNKKTAYFQWGKKYFLPVPGLAAICKKFSDGDVKQFLNSRELSFEKSAFLI